MSTEQSEHSVAASRPDKDAAGSESYLTDPAYLNMDLLRFTTAGSVDDGKSTLIGRLLYDSKSIFEDQWEALETTAQSRGEEGVNLALLTDGLRAEREQGITIDVAYRYFATPKRKFIIADTPGHEQYTRNMVTGASTADLAIVLLDARKGVLTQSRRHAFLSSLLQIPHLVVAVNKMDLVGYSEERFDEIVEDFKEFSRHLNVNNITYVPISALKGDNIVHGSEAMSWYKGSTLLHHLEHVKVDSRTNPHDFRFPVQYVIRPDQDYRGFAGRVVSGHISSGENITVLPSGETTHITSIRGADGPVDKAEAGESVVIELDREIDISRGDMLVRSQNIPLNSPRFEAVISWMNREELLLDKSYIIQHTSRTAKARITDIRYRLNIDTLHREDADRLALNEIGRVLVETSTPLFFDAYKLNNATGSFILIDPDTNVTVGAGMMQSRSTSARDVTKEEVPASRKEVETRPKAEVFSEPWNIERKIREEKNGHKAQVVWLTGPSGAGKTSISKALEKKLWDKGFRTVLLDGDQLRHGLNRDLGLSDDDRKENIRRAAETAKLFFEHGNIVLCAFISPFRAGRKWIREQFPEESFVEVGVQASKEERIRRDPKGLYKKAIKGELSGLTGFDADYEEPGKEAWFVDTEQRSVEQAASDLMEKIIERIKL
ncbi:sulfate adenylyltransferase subunit CysN [Balneolaceae bacterium ANBcel3]|nr:sulfate adenylyltransferase subunit CysN [Balneolaceae bacterium ANBcel3]